jgi:TPR repeat protein
MIRPLVLFFTVVLGVVHHGQVGAQESALRAPVDNGIKIIDGKTPGAVDAVFKSGLDAYNVQDYATARNAWAELSNANHPEGMHNHAVMLWRGQGGDQDRSSAIALFEKSAALENPVSLHALGALALSRKSDPVDVYQAIGYFEQASALGYGPSSYNLAVMYWNGVGVDTDKDTALEFFEAAAEGGYTRAQYDLAGLLYRGEHVARDLDSARTWFAQAAESGDPFKQYNLALMALAGEGGDVDIDLAYDQLSRAAHGGAVPAQMRLAAMLATGEHNGEKDLTTALMWYQIAYSFGAENASHNADMVKKALDSKQIETATARARQFKPRSDIQRMRSEAQ